jgi:hypothetical protein
MWSLFYFILLAPRILRWPLNFWKNLCTPALNKIACVSKICYTLFQHPEVIEVTLMSLQPRCHLTRLRICHVVVTNYGELTKVWRWSDFQWHNICIKFRQNRLANSKFEMGTQTHRRAVKHTCFLFRNEDRLIKTSFMLCTPQQILAGWSNQEEWDGRGMWHAWGTGEVRIECWWQSLAERLHLDNLGVDGRIILEWIVQIIESGGWGLDWSGWERGQVVGCCEYCNEPSGSVESGEFRN